MQKGSKKGAMELSMSTIVILVLGVTLLIFGIVLVRNIMCSGISITEDLSQGVKNQVKNLFGADQFGAHCVGEGGQEIKIGTGGQRKLTCFIKAETQSVYDLKVDILEVTGTTKTEVAKWTIKKGATNVNVAPGGDGTEVAFLILNVPRTAPATTLVINIEATAKSGDSGTRTIESVINIAPTGAVKSAIC